MFYFLISVVYIKEELQDVAIDVKLEPDVDSFLKKEDGNNEALTVKGHSQSTGTNYSMDKLVIKDEPQQDNLGIILFLIIFYNCEIISCSSCDDYIFILTMVICCPFA